jgi:hypothetical protein
VVRERSGREYECFGYLLHLSICLAANGQLAQAARIADETAASAATMPGSDGRFHYNATIRAMNARAGEIKAQTIRIAEQARQRVLDLGRQALDEGADPIEAAGRQRHDSRRDAAAEIAAQPPWPSLADGRLLWWPHAEYTKLVRQVPDLTGILGSTWREHTTPVETFAAAATTAGSSAPQVRLAHADFAIFAAYLEKTGADPRLSTVQTAFTRHAGAGYAYPARWPPGGRFACWCGSHKKYQHCCGASPAATSKRRR